jgi:hypothetical protein
MRSRTWVHAAMWCMAMLGAAVSMAVPAQQGQVEEKPAFQVHKVQLKAQPELIEHGKSAFFHGTVDEAGLGFELSELGILQPVAVSVFAIDPAQPVSLRISSDEWKAVERESTSDSKGFTTQQFRAQSWAQVRVFSPSGPRKFQLVIWAGDEKTDYPDMPTSIKYGALRNGKAAGASDAAAAPAAGGGNTVLWVIAGLLGALVIIALIFVLRRKS